MSPCLHTAIIDLSGPDTVSYQYMCREADVAPPLATFQKTFRRERLMDCAAALMRSLQHIRAPAIVEAEMQQWGGRLYDELIPQELSDALRRDTGASNLIMYLDPACSWIPWELLWDGEEFLCRRFRLGRLLLKSGQELRAATERLRGERSGRGALIVFGDIAGLDARDEKTVVENNLNAVYGRSNVWFYPARGAADILDELKKDYQVCHFVGHGEFRVECPAQSGWRFADGSVLTCRDIEAVSSRAAFPFLIFANSCYSACPTIADAHAYVTTLYRAFLRKGVPHYIGTIVPIPDAPAKDFAHSFYGLLVQGLSVGEALGETRRAFAERTRVAIWGSYVHYGDPTLRLLGPSENPTAFRETQPAGHSGLLHNNISFSILGKTSSDEIRRMLEQYKMAVAKNTGDGEAHYAIALCYLQLELHELAIKNFKRALELMPDDADTYYYYGLSLLRGRRPKLLSLTEVKRIEEYLETALQLNNRPAKYYYLAAILKYDYYLSNGLLCHPSPDELLYIAEGKEYDAWEVERLLQTVRFRDPDLLSIIRKHEAVKL